MLCKILLLTSPFLVVLLSYFVFDPFQVLYHYPTFEPKVAIGNRDYVSTQMYLNTYEQRPYRSFILGNSRTLAFHIRDWEHYIQDTMAFHYDASGESLYGVWKKLQFLEQHHSELKNVLLICDESLLFRTSDYDNPIFRKDPRLLGKLPLSFQVAFLKSYYSDLYFYKFLKYQLLGTFTPDMADVMDSRRVYYDPVTNDLILPDINQEIKSDSAGFYARNTRVKAQRKPGVSDAVLGAEQMKQLVAIRNIFSRHNTNYQIVISPLFDQKRLNPADLAIMQRIFTAKRIHDFSGVNDITNQIGNYYEESHYRPLIGRTILKAIYAPTK